MSPELEVISLLQDWSVVYDLAESYRKQEQWQQAIAAYQRAIHLNPEFFWSYHHLGDAARQLQQWEIAAQAYQKAVTIDPQFFWSWHNLGDVCQKLEQWHQAVQALQEAVKLDPQFFWSWNNLGDALVNLEEWDQAIAAYLQCIFLDSESQPVHRKLGQALQRRGSLEATIQYYRRQLTQTPPHAVWGKLATQPQTLIDIAQALISNQQKQGAIILYYLVLELRPDLANVRSLLQGLTTEYQLAQQATQNPSLNPNPSAPSLLLEQLTINPVPKVTSAPASGEIRLRKNQAIALVELQDLYGSVGWSNRLPEKLQQALQASFHISAWYQDRDTERLIGFVRAITDGAFHATILDLVVHPQFKGQGLEEGLVTALIQNLQEAEINNVSAFANLLLTDFYQRLGFDAQPKGLQWMLWNGANR